MGQKKATGVKKATIRGSVLKARLQKPKSRIQDPETKIQNPEIMTHET